MKKNEMREKFRGLLEQTMEAIREEREKGKTQAAMMYYGKLCGIASSMYVIGIIDYGQKTDIVEDAVAILEGKEPEYEPEK